MKLNADCSVDGSRWTESRWFPTFRRFLFTQPSLFVCAAFRCIASRLSFLSFLLRFIASIRCHDSAFACHICWSSVVFVDAELSAEDTSLLLSCVQAQLEGGY